MEIKCGTLSPGITELFICKVQVGSCVKMAKSGFKLFDVCTVSVPSWSVTRRCLAAVGAGKSSERAVWIFRSRARSVCAPKRGWKFFLFSFLLVEFCGSRIASSGRRYATWSGQYRLWTFTRMLCLYVLGASRSQMLALNLLFCESVIRKLPSGKDVTRRLALGPSN